SICARACLPVPPVMPIPSRVTRHDIMKSLVLSKNIPLKLVLASTSVYRRMLLEKLRIPFAVDRPEVDETALPGEAPADLALRLSRAKAAAVAPRHPGALIIGSDQVATFDGQVMGKPGNRDNAVRQLRQLSGRNVSFLTGVCVHNADTGRQSARLGPCEVGC